MNKELRKNNIYFGNPSAFGLTTDHDVLYAVSQDGVSTYYGEFTEAEGWMFDDQFILGPKADEGRSHRQGKSLFRSKPLSAIGVWQLREEQNG